MHPIFEQFPGARRIAYFLSFAVGLGLGAAQVGYAAAETAQPPWLTVTLAVYAFVAAALGITAAQNIPRSTATWRPRGVRRRGPITP